MHRASFEAKPLEAVNDPPIRYEPRLVEEAVFRVVYATPFEVELRTERDPLYEIEDPDIRETGFHDLYGRWFQRLRLAAPLEQALADVAIPRDGIARIRVRWAPTKSTEGADLLITRHPVAERTVVIRLRPERFLDLDGILAFLRRELLHVLDMLDPAFGYEPEFPNADDDPSRKRMMTERYRVLWSTTVGGRMFRQGWAGPGERETRRAEFVAAFAELGPAADDAFSRVFEAERPTHGQIVARALLPSMQDHVGQALRCSLCGASTYAFEPGPASLPPAIRTAIEGDFAGWSPDDGICVQCADLYRNGEMSAAALATLPGIR